MKSKFALMSLLIVVPGLLMLISGCASTSPLAAREANYPAGKVNARALFMENCATCHGRDGRAHTFHGWIVGAQNLASPKWQIDTTDYEIAHAIKTGPGMMPAFGKKLSSSEIQALTSYVRTFNPAPEGNQK